MRQSDYSKPIIQTATLGILAGMRTNAAPAVASHILSSKGKQISDGPLKFMDKPLTATITKVLLAGELVGDKLPNAPNRTTIAGLIGRCLAGALAGGAIFKADGKSAVAGALLGTLTAAGATYGAFYLRNFAVDKTHIADPIIGAIEDVLTVSAGAALIMSA